MIAPPPTPLLLGVLLLCTRTGSFGRELVKENAVQTAATTTTTPLPTDPEEMYARMTYELSPADNTALKPGEPFDLVLDIHVPQMDHVPATDIKVEVFGYAVYGTVYTRFALYEPRWLLDDEHQSADESSAHLDRSTQFPNIYHAGIFTLKDFTSSEAGNLTLTIKAALLKLSPMTSGSSYPVSVAVSFGGGLYGWSEQGMYICSQDDVTYDFVGNALPNATGSTGQLSARGADRIDVVLKYTNPSDTLYLEAVGTSDKEDIFTLTAIEIQAVGKSFSACGAFLLDVNETSVFTASPSGRSSLSVSRNFGGILNCGGEQPRSATADDQIILGFGVFSNGEVGDTFKLNVKVQLGGSDMMSQELMFELVESSPADLLNVYQNNLPSDRMTLGVTEPALGLPPDITAGRHVTIDMTYHFYSRLSQESIAKRDEAIASDLSVLHGQLIVTATEAQPCGVSAGPSGQSVSPMVLPLDGPTVFSDNSSMVLLLGPVIYTGLMDYKPVSSNTSDTTVRLTLRISDTATNPSVSVTFRDWTAVTLTIPLTSENEKTSDTTSQTLPLQGNVISVLPRLTGTTKPTLYSGGVIGFNMSVFVPPGASYPDFLATVAREKAGSGQLRLCRAAVLSVGANMPCNTHSFSGAVTSTTSDASFTYPAPVSAGIQLGPVCALQTSPDNATGTNLVVANFVYQHLAKFGPNNTFEDANLPNPLELTASVASAALLEGFAGQISFPTSVSQAKLAPVPSSQPRKVWTSVRGEQPFRLGQTVLADLHFKWTPGVVADTWWRVDSTDADDTVKFCDIRVTHVGDNYACKSAAVFRRLLHNETYDSPETDYAEQSRAKDSLATSMTVHLMRYANAGMWPTYADTGDLDQDTVSTTVALAIPATSGATASFNVALFEVGYVWTAKISMQVDTDATATVAEPRSLTFTADNGEDWSVYPGVLKTFDIILNLDDDFERTVKLIIESADTEPKYDACCAFVTFVGENTPCVDVYNIKSEISKSSTSVSGRDVLTLDMGRLCAAPFVPRNVTTNQVKVTVGVRPRDTLSGGDQLGVTVTVLMDGTEMAAGEQVGGPQQSDIAPASSGELSDIAPADVAPASSGELSDIAPATSGEMSDMAPATSERRRKRSAAAGQGAPLAVTFTVSAEKFTGEAATGELGLVNVTEVVSLVTITETAWVRFNVSLPASSVGRLSLRWSGYSEQGRAALVPTGGLRFLERGRNVPCAATRDMNETIELTSSLSGSSQKDVLFLDVGYVTNTGMSHTRLPTSDWSETDDMIQFEAEFRFSDHPRATHETPLPVTLKVTYGALETSLSQGVALKRLGTEMPDMELEVWTVNDTPYQPNAQVPVDVMVRNKNTSTADAINVTVTLAVPPYIAFAEVAWTNFSQLPEVAVRRHALLVSWPRLAIADQLHVRLLLRVDPDNVRGFGAGYAAATTPVFLRATMFQRYGIPEKDSGMYPPPGKLWYPLATPTYVTFDVNSEECYIPLGITTGSVDDCQMSASSAADSSRLPHMARLQPCAADQQAASANQSVGEQVQPRSCVGTTGWSPEQRGAPFRPWHQVDFGNLTRVSGLLLARPAATRRVSRFRLQHSLAGASFSDLTPVTPLDWTAEHSKGVVIFKLEKAVETRYVRFIIEEAEEGDDQYIGLQLEYLGCQRSQDFPLESTCASQPATPTSDDAERNRHFAVDTANNHIYFCDFVQSRGRRVCYASSDSTTWRRLPDVIEQMIGFDESTGRMYGTGSRGDAPLWSSDGGISWAPETKAEFETLSQSPGFFSALDVPSQTPDAAGFSSRSIGDWSAGYEGLSQAGQLMVKWSALSCST